MKCLKNKEYNLNGYKIVPYREEDMFKIMKWRNEQMNVLRQIKPLKEEEQYTYFYNFIKPTFEEEHPKQILFSYLLNNECIGYGGLTNIDWYNKKAELSFLLDTIRTKNNEIYENDFTVFIRLIYIVIFEDLEFNRLYTETYEFRDFHISVLEKNGFKREGILRSNRFINDVFVNSILHSILKREYESIFKK